MSTASLTVCAQTGQPVEGIQKRIDLEVRNLHSRSHHLPAVVTAQPLNLSESQFPLVSKRDNNNVNLKGI